MQEILHSLDIEQQKSVTVTGIELSLIHISL